LILLLQDKPKSRAELIKVSGFAEATVHNWINLLKEKKMIYISEYIITGKARPTALFSFGFNVEDISVEKFMLIRRIENAGTVESVDTDIRV